MRMFLAAIALVALASAASAERVPSSRVQIQYSPGARGDMTVPYLTNGTSPLGVAQGVSPIIMSKPGLGTANNNNVKPVFNLIYYGSKQSANSSFNGAIPRGPNQLRPGR